jgi:acetyl esterase/lipase
MTGKADATGTTGAADATGTSGTRGTPSASPRVRTVRDLEYAPRASGALAFDLHHPEGAGSVPLVIYLHGGGWVRGTRTGFEEQRLLPLAAAGFAVAAISYRLVDVARWPAQLDDAREALGAIPRIAADAGAELSGRTALWGVSAGAQIALLTALTAAEQGTAGADAVVAFFPPADLALMTTAPWPPNSRRPPFAPQEGPLHAFERDLLGVPDAEFAAAAREASPIAHVTGAAPPILLMHGDEDGMTSPWHTTELFRALRAAGAPVDALYVAGATHEDPAFDSPAVLGAVAGHLRGRA